MTLESMMTKVVVDMEDWNLSENEKRVTSIMIFMGHQNADIMTAAQCSIFTYPSAWAGCDIRFFKSRVK